LQIVCEAHQSTVIGMKCGVEPPPQSLHTLGIRLTLTLIAGFYPTPIP